MTWWQILLAFAGIPAAMFLLITVAVLRFATAGVPDGLLHAGAHEDEDDPAPRNNHDVVRQSHLQLASTVEVH